MEEELKEGQRPKIAATINEYFMPAEKRPAECDSDGEQVTYLPVWIAQAEIRAEKDKMNFSLRTVKAAEIDEEGMRGFDEFAKKYRAGLAAEKAAVGKHCQHCSQSGHPGHIQILQLLR